MICIADAASSVNALMLNEPDLIRVIKFFDQKTQ